jgi:hypothetical protein
LGGRDIEGGSIKPSEVCHARKVLTYPSVPDLSAPGHFALLLQEGNGPGKADQQDGSQRNGQIVEYGNFGRKYFMKYCLMWV